MREIETEPDAEREVETETEDVGRKTAGFGDCTNLGGVNFGVLATI